MYKQVILKAIGKSYDESDIPSTFKVVFDLLKSKKALKQGYFKNMQGISGSGTVIFRFLGRSNDAFLIMDSREVLKYNKLSKMMYDNPHYLVSKDFKALKRLIATNDRFFVIKKILEEIPANLPYSEAQDILEGGVRSYSNKAGAWEKKMPKIKNLYQLSEWLRKKTNENLIPVGSHLAPFNKKDFAKAIYESVKSIGEIFTGEQEWVIKGNRFNIPTTSKLYVLMPSIDLNSIKKLDLLSAFERMGEEKFKEDLRTNLGLAAESLIETTKKMVLIDEIPYATKYLSRSKFEELKDQFFKQKDENLTNVLVE